MDHGWVFENRVGLVPLASLRRRMCLLAPTQSRCKDMNMKRGGGTGTLEQNERKGAKGTNRRNERAMTLMMSEDRALALFIVASSNILLSTL